MNRREFIASAAAFAIEVKMVTSASANVVQGIPKLRSASPLCWAGGRLARLLPDAVEVRTVGKKELLSLPLAGARGLGRLGPDQLVAIGQARTPKLTTTVLCLAAGQSKPSEHHGAVPLAKSWAPIFPSAAPHEILVVDDYASAWRLGNIGPGAGEFKLGASLDLDPNCEQTLTSHGDGTLTYFFSAQVVRKPIAGGADAHFPLAGEWLEHLAPGPTTDQLWATTSSGKLARVALEKNGAHVLGAIDLHAGMIVHMHAAPAFAAVLVAKDPEHFELVVADEKHERWRAPVAVTSPYQPPYVAVSPTHVAVADAQQVTIWDAVKGTKV